MGQRHDTTQHDATLRQARIIGRTSPATYTNPLTARRDTTRRHDRQHAIPEGRTPLPTPTLSRHDTTRHDTKTRPTQQHAIPEGRTPLPTPTLSRHDTTRRNDQRNNTQSQKEGPTTYTNPLTTRNDTTRHAPMHSHLLQSTSHLAVKPPNSNYDNLNTDSFFSFV